MAPIFAFKMATKMAAEISNYAQIFQSMMKSLPVRASITLIW